MALARRMMLFSFVALFTAFSTPVHAVEPDDREGRIELTARERQWLAEHPIVRVAPDPGYQPIESLDDNGRLVGISADYLKLLESKVAIRFEIVAVSSWDEAMSMARSRKVDMLSAATKTAARSEHMLFTTPHIELPGVIIVRNTAGDYSGLDEFRDKKVGVVSSYVWQEWITRDHPAIDLIPVRDMSTGLLLVSFGQLDAMVGNLATATHYIQKLGVTNLRVAAETGYFARLAIATRRDWPELNTILEKAVSAISRAENQAIHDRWIKLESATRFDTRTILLGVLIIIAVAGLALAGNLMWNYSLRRMVRRQRVSLRGSEERFRAVVEDQTELIGRSLPHVHTLTFVNRAYYRCFGKTREELIGTSFMDHVPEEDRDEVDERLATLSVDNPIVHVEHSAVTADGEVRWHQWTDRAIFDDDGNITEIQAVGRDITERKRAEVALHDSEERLRDAIESISDGFILYDADDRFVLCNGKYRDFYPSIADVARPGAKLEDVARAAFEADAVRGSARNVEEWMKIRLRQHRTAQGSHEQQLADGRWVLCSERRTSGGGTVGIRTEITDRKLAEDMLHESEQRYRLLVEASPDAILVTGEDGIVRFANSTAVDLFGADSVDRLIGMNMLDLVHADDRADVVARRRQVLRGTRPAFAQRRRLRLDGSDFYSESRGVPFTWDGGAAVLIVIRDITERKKTEEQLRQAQKMEAVGQLTGGVAHDFNNLLMVVLGNLDMAKDDLADDSDVSALVARARAAAERGATLTHRLLAFSRKQALKPGIIDLNGLVAGMADLLRRTLGEIVEIETVSTDDLWPCEADSSQIENALLNLAINARDAMPEGGKLTIETGNVDFDEDYAAAQADVTAGNYVMVAVTDTGVGMPRHVIDHAFEPFFTTKQMGSGSGLGLSMIYGFVKQSGGHISIYSEEGVGTTVKMYLPRSFAGAEEEVRHEEGETAPRARGETILVVEDDTDVRTLTVALLGGLGYQILEAEDGDSALAALDQAAPVDLLFTNVVLPGGMGGPALAEEVKRRVPGVSVLFTSGYTDNAIIHQGRLDKGVELLNKPFRKAELARKVRSVLDKAES